MTVTYFYVGSSYGYLQVVQHVVVGLLRGNKYSNVITPVFTSLSSLPVNFRIQFNILSLPFRRQRQEDSEAETGAKCYITPWFGDIQGLSFQQHVRCKPCA